MELLSRIADAQKEAMKARDTARLSTVRMILAAVKDKEIALRTSGQEMSEGEVLALLGKMVKQRQESAKVYVDGGRQELADKELAEVGVIETFLPKALSPAEVDAAIGRRDLAAGHGQGDGGPEGEVHWPDGFRRRGRGSEVPARLRPMLR
jgi:uncharacterized protein YqeY